MPDLITTSRAVQNPTLASLGATNPAYLASLISAASDAVRHACRRDFTLSTYSEYHSGGIYICEPLRLRQFPVVQITRVAASPQPALLVQNVDALSNQRATVETTATAVRLVTVVSAVLSTTDLLFATYPTIAAIAGAINALGHGLSATVVSGYANWPSADLNPMQGAANTLNGGQRLELYSETVQPFGDGSFPFDGDFHNTSSGWRLDVETGEVFGRFPRGQLNIRIDYRAGFDTIPAAVQEACVQVVQDLYQAGLVNSTLKKATLGPSSVELKNTSAAVELSPKVQLLLAPYRDYAKVIYR